MTQRIAADGPATVRVALPGQLRMLAGVEGEVVVSVAEPVTLAETLGALERWCPRLRGTIRDQATHRRRAMIRIYADGEDLSDADGSQLLPASVTDGSQPLRIVGAIAGG